MEVPCCGGLPTLIQDALGMAGADIPVRVITLSTSGTEVQPL
jgi:hypothetical protein